MLRGDSNSNGKTPKKPRTAESCLSSLNHSSGSLQPTASEAQLVQLSDQANALIERKKAEELYYDVTPGLSMD